MIQINKDWRIDSDPYNWILQKRSVTKNTDEPGKEYWKNEGYYPTVAAAFKGMVNQEIKIPPDVQKVLDRLNELHVMIDQKLSSDNIEQKVDVEEVEIDQEDENLDELDDFLL